MESEPPRSREARAAAERAMIRIVHHYGTRPEFVVLGGLVPEILCAASNVPHAGTTDIDVQVDLEIAAGSINTRRLEQALRNAEFRPDSERVWRWIDAESSSGRTVVKFELLADLEDVRAEHEFRFDDCEKLGAVNLRGTGFAARDAVPRVLTARIGGVMHTAEINVTGLAGFLLAKAAAAHSRHKTKDWYDIAFVLLHNDRGGPEAAAVAVREGFAAELTGSVRTALVDLHANFAEPRAQGPRAYAEQMLVDQPDLDGDILAADAVLAVEAFYRAVLPPSDGAVLT